MALFAKMGKRERSMVIALGVVAVLAIVYLLVAGGGGGNETAGPSGGATFNPGARGRTTLTPTPQPSVETTPFESFEGKDPFRPLILPSGAGGSPGGTASPGASGGTQQGTHIVLLDIYTQNGTRFASVQVGNDIHNVKAGDTFAGSYRVVTITDQCATFVNGDERFTLCIGQEVFK